MTALDHSPNRRNGHDVQPFDADAERAVLGACLISSDAVPRVRLAPDDFFDRRHALIWSAMLRLDADEKPIDVILLERELDPDHLRAIGGLAYLSDCMSSSVTADNVEHYAAIVAEHALTRRIRLAASRLVNSRFEGEELRELAVAQLRPLARPASSEEPEAPRIVWLGTSVIFEPLPPTPWVIRELGLCPGRPSMIAGYGYSGKTLASQALMLAAASGREAWGHFATGTPMRVRHLDFEQGRHATLKRYQRLAVGMDLHMADLAPRLEVAIFPSAYLNAQDAYDVYMRLSEGCAFVLVDALAGATPGEAENESTMRSYIDMLGHVSEKTGACFILVHHAGKLTENHDKDPRTIVRGHSGIFDACGGVLVFSGAKNGPVMVRQVKAPAEAEGQAIDPFYLLIEDTAPSEFMPAGVRITHKASEEAEAEKREEKAGAAEAREAAKIAKVEAALPPLMEAIWMAMRRASPRSVKSTSMIRDLVPGMTSIKQAAVTKLVASGRIVRSGAPEKGGDRWYEAV